MIAESLKISEQTASELTLHSRSCPKDQDITSFLFLQRALLLAELSKVVYLPYAEASKAAAHLGFDSTIFYSNDGSQAYWFANDCNIVIAFRGTEPNEWNDITAGMKGSKSVAETVGHVHRGFKKEVDNLWPQICQSLEANKQSLCKKLWFTGHSLGGAMASICAVRCLLSPIDTLPEQVHTFGSPKVGTRRYINHARVNYFRWVNNNDIVTRLPPEWLGYRHSGQEIYIDSDGQINTLNAPERKADMLKGLISGFKRIQIDYFSDHSIDRYIAHIHRALKQAAD